VLKKRDWSENPIFKVFTAIIIELLILNAIVMSFGLIIYMIFLALFK